MLDFIYLTCIALSVICGLIFTKKLSHIAYKLFIVFLAVTLFNEVFCYFMKMYMDTQVFYNIYYYFRFPYLAFIFHTVFTKKKKYIHYFTWSFYIASIVLFFVCMNLYHGISGQLHTLYLAVGGTFVIINCLLLFYESVKSEEIIKPFAYPFFLCSMALFLYFLGILPFFGIINFLTAKGGNYLNPTLIARLLSIVIYSLISVDYYLQWKRMKSH